MNKCKPIICGRTDQRRERIVTKWIPKLCERGYGVSLVSMVRKANK